MQDVLREFLVGEAKGGAAAAEAMVKEKDVVEGQRGYSTPGRLVPL